MPRDDGEPNGYGGSQRLGFKKLWVGLLEVTTTNKSAGILKMCRGAPIWRTVYVRRAPTPPPPKQRKRKKQTKHTTPKKQKLVKLLVGGFAPKQLQLSCVQGFRASSLVYTPQGRVRGLGPVHREVRLRGIILREGP